MAGRIDCGEPRGRDLGQPRAGGQSPHPTVPAPTPEAGGLTLPRGLAGENVTAFFSRVAALAFEQSVLQALERRSGCPLQVGDGDLIRAYRPRVEGSGGVAGGRLWPQIHLHPPTPSGRPFSRHSDPGPPPPRPACQPRPLPAPLSAWQSPHKQAGHQAPRWVLAVALLVPTFAHHLECVPVLALNERP